MSMMTSQSLKFVDFTKTEKSRYQQKQIFFQVKSSLITHQGVALWQKKMLIKNCIKLCLYWVSSSSNVNVWGSY